MSGLAAQNSPLLGQFIGPENLTHLTKTAALSQPEQTGAGAADVFIGPRNYRTTLLPSKIDSVSRVVMTWLR